MYDIDEENFNDDVRTDSNVEIKDEGVTTLRQDPEVERAKQIKSNIDNLMAMPRKARRMIGNKNYVKIPGTNKSYVTPLPERGI